MLPSTAACKTRFVVYWVKNACRFSFCSSVCVQLQCPACDVYGIRIMHTHIIKNNQPSIIPSVRTKFFPSGTWAVCGGISTKQTSTLVYQQHLTCIRIHTHAYRPSFRNQVSQNKPLHPLRLRHGKNLRSRNPPRQRLPSKKQSLLRLRLRQRRSLQNPNLLGNRRSRLQMRRLT